MLYVHQGGSTFPPPPIRIRLGGSRPPFYLRSRMDLSINMISNTSIIMVMNIFLCLHFLRERLPFHRRLLESGWLGAAPLSLSAESHGFVDGAQHLKRAADRMRASSFGTTVAVLQTTEGAKTWRCVNMCIDISVCICMDTYTVPKTKGCPVTKPPIGCALHCLGRRWMCFKSRRGQDMEVYIYMCIYVCVCVYRYI